MKKILNISEDLAFKRINSYIIAEIKGEPKLRGKASQILELLIKHENKRVSFNKIFEDIWELHDWDSFNVRSLDVYLTKIRKELRNWDNVSLVRHNAEYALTLEIV